jgi:DNA-binding MarR family transcriptional regulator
VLDLDRFRLTAVQQSNEGSKTRARKRGKFVKGPIPLAWLEQAGSLPGKTLQVGMCLWFQSGLNHDARQVSLSLSSVARRFQINRSTASRALATLERAGLVSVTRRAGRKVDVLIHDER